MRYLSPSSGFDSGRASLSLEPADNVQAIVLAAGVAERVTLPVAAGGQPAAKYCLFSATGDFFAKFGDNTVTAIVPSGDITDGTAPELNPVMRTKPSGVTHVSLISASAITVTIAFYS